MNSEEKEDRSDKREDLDNEEEFHKRFCKCDQMQMGTVWVEGQFLKSLKQEGSGTQSSEYAVLL